MEFTDLIKKRRSIRAYKEVSIGHSEIVEILKQAQQAPSWKNQQTSKCYVLEREDDVETIRAAALPPFNQKSSENAVLIVTTFVTDVVGYSDGEPVNEAGNCWGAYDLGLHDAYLILAASNAGFDTLIMGIRDADALRFELGIPENEQIMSVIALGKRAKEPVQRPRNELEEVTRFFRDRVNPEESENRVIPE